jgi:hypothetical protein
MSKAFIPSSIVKEYRAFIVKEYRVFETGTSLQAKNG